MIRLVAPGDGTPIRDAMAGVTLILRMYHQIGHQPTPYMGGVPPPPVAQVPSPGRGLAAAHLTNAVSGGMIGHLEPKGGGREDLRP